MPRILHGHPVRFEPRASWGSGPAVPLTEFVTHPAGGAVDAISLTVVDAPYSVPGAPPPSRRGTYLVELFQLLDGKETVVSVDDKIRSVSSPGTVEILGFRVIEPDGPLFLRFKPLMAKSSYVAGTIVLATAYLLEDEAR